MSKYTTGEMAKLCNITVRTVQYYDTRNILTPNELSDGGRRLYSENDLEKLKLICVLRNLGLSIETIKEILEEKNSGEVITMLLKKQAQTLRSEVAARQQQIEKITDLTKGMKNVETFSIDSVNDIAYSMENRQKLKKTYTIMLVIGILLDIFEIGALWLWIAKGIWIPFAVIMPFVILCATYLVRLYYKNAAYICPDCHSVFKPAMKEFFFAAHTPKTRKLTCTSCGHHGFCIETYDDKRTISKND